MVYLSLLEPLLQSYSSEVTNNKALDIISNNIDWAYIFFWFFSFYGQLYETLKPNMFKEGILKVERMDGHLVVILLYKSSLLQFILQEQQLQYKQLIIIKKEIIQDQVYDVQFYQQFCDLKHQYIQF
ncbi:unnamed protein product [Paramecium sonneborni]|uniref:Uncharacterized protein n=1 Tax=Paramecium sonneborni TaxID=65129 RepID=A0A8S1RLV9_9CILI|nr:unnamed protein product [Paramecium sonneborni]